MMVRDASGIAERQTACGWVVGWAGQDGIEVGESCSSVGARARAPLSPGARDEQREKILWGSKRGLGDGT